MASKPDEDLTAFPMPVHDVASWHHSKSRRKHDLGHRLNEDSLQPLRCQVVMQQLARQSRGLRDIRITLGIQAVTLWPLRITIPALEKMIALDEASWFNAASQAPQCQIGSRQFGTTRLLRCQLLMWQGGLRDAPNIRGLAAHAELSQQPCLPMNRNCGSTRRDALRKAD